MELELPVVTLSNITECDGLLTGTSDSGDEFIVRGTFACKTLVVTRSNVIIPCGVFIGHLRSHRDELCEVHFKCDSGILVEQSSRMLHGLFPKRVCASYAVFWVPGFGEQVLTREPGMVWQPNEGIFVGRFWRELVCINNQ